MGEEIELEFDKIVCEGKALGRYKGKVVFAYGVLPNEKARVRKVVEKRNFIEGEVVEILSKSPFRVDPKEDHFLSCSPWQIISYEKQLDYKKKIMLDGLYQSTKEIFEVNYFYSASEIFGYRTKIEYSFTNEEQISLAFHKRGDYSNKIRLKSGCVLINPKVNSIALNIVEQLKKQGLVSDIFKSLVLRYSFSQDSVISVLFIKDEKISPKIDLFLDGHKGHINVYSNPRSPVSIVDKILDVVGEKELYEVILEKRFFYNFDSFFQNNIKLFEKAVEIIKANVVGKRVLDLYCGVGVIGLSVCNEIEDLVGCESAFSSVEYAKRNVLINGINKKVSFLEMPSEDIDGEILKDSCLIVDPPRSGMHKKLIKKILSFLPKRIIYLSCNPVTQGRDIFWLLDKYVVSSCYGFDFYPNTPHVESLLILDRK